MMTRYQKELAREVAHRYGHLSCVQLVEELCRIGVVDHTLCKVFAVRRYVDQLVKEGTGKVDAMWAATEQFCSTYEYVRKCMYYYTDINL
jgi:ribosomal protein L17